METRLAEIRQIAARPAWVAEGVFLGWTDDLFMAADTVVWLDLPWRLAGWRIFMRHVKAELRGDNRHPGWLKLYRFLRWSRRYYLNKAVPQPVRPGSDIEENRALTADYLVGFKNKLVRCGNQGEVKAFLDSLF